MKKKKKKKNFKQKKNKELGKNRGRGEGSAPSCPSLGRPCRVLRVQPLAHEKCLLFNFTMQSRAVLRAGGRLLRSCCSGRVRCGGSRLVFRRRGARLGLARNSCHPT